MKQINWSERETERESKEKRAEMRKPIAERYKAKAKSRMLHECGVGSSTHVSLGDGGFMKKNISCGF